MGVCDLGSDLLRESVTGGSADVQRLEEAAKEACCLVSRVSRADPLSADTGTGVGAASEPLVGLDDDDVEDDALAASSPFRRNDSLVVRSVFSSGFLASGLSPFRTRSLVRISLSRLEAGEEVLKAGDTRAGEEVLVLTAGEDVLVAGDEVRCAGDEVLVAGDDLPAP